MPGDNIDIAAQSTIPASFEDNLITVVALNCAGFINLLYYERIGLMLPAWDGR